MNLQIHVPDIDHLQAQALRSGTAIDTLREERFYRKGYEEEGNRQLSPT